MMDNGLRLPAFDPEVDPEALHIFGSTVDEALGLVRSARTDCYLDSRSTHHDAIRTMLHEVDERLTEIAEALGGPV